MQEFSAAHSDHQSSVAAAGLSSSISCMSLQSVLLPSYELLYCVLKAAA